jgi:PAS domain S-box-containing protein
VFQATLGLGVALILLAWGTQGALAIPDDLGLAGASTSQELPWIWGAWTLAAVIAGVFFLLLWNALLRKRVNEAVRGIRERQDTLNAIVETSHDWIWAIDSEGIHTFSNPAVRDILGYDQEDIIGRDCGHFLHPEDRDTVASHWDQWKVTKTGWKNLPLRWMHKDGSYRLLESSAVPILTPEGALAGFRGVDRDITDRRKAEQAIQDSERTLRQILDLVPHSIFAKDRVGRFLLVNQRCAELMGTTLEEAVGKTQSELTPDPEECRILLEEDREVLDTDTPIWKREHTYTDLEGQTHIEEAIKVPFDFPGTEEKVVLGICLDVTDRKRAEEALRESENHFRSLIEHSTDVFTFVEIDGTIRYTSPSVERVLGYSSEENVGRSMFDLVHPEDLDAVLPVYRASTEKVGVAQRVECRLRHKDGSWREVEVSGKSLTDPRGKIMGVVSYHDIGERKRLEAQLRQSQKMEAIGQLAGGVAHDFNNLLVVILGHAELAQDQSPAGWAGREDLAQIRSAAERAASLTKQLLAFSRRQILSTVELDLNEVVGGLTKLLVRLIGEHINLQLVPGSNLRPIRGDRDQIGQVIMNLCVNSRDAMPEGGTIMIETGAVTLAPDDCAGKEWAEPGAYSTLKVTDTGTGMDKWTLSRIFEPFFTTKEVGQGTGLGLPTVYGIVKQHEGLVHVESSPAVGTAFTIYFPVSNSSPEASGEEGSGKTRGGSETLLLAEDETAVRELGVRVLEEAGYRVLVAGNGEECLEILENSGESIDLAILDVVMPKMGGLAVHDRIRDCDPHFPILFTTGYSLDVVRKNLKFQGETQLVQKPYRPADLLKKVRETLDYRSAP